ncbi:hypothetical protein [Terasakiella sp.]|uniref:hypothetical protein n=1 Tax=Terasakiella sp. TaxID=2034861 RepID=UPI003AA84E43
MKPWEPGDPVGCGEVFFADGSARQAYGDACRAQLVVSYAHHVMNGRSRPIRQARVSRCPKQVRQAVKDMVEKMWAERQAQKDLFAHG